MGTQGKEQRCSAEEWLVQGDRAGRDACRQARRWVAEADRTLFAISMVVGEA